MSVTNQEKKLKGLLQNNKTQSQKYRKFLGNKSQSSLFKRQINLANASMYRGQTSKSILSQKSNSSRHTIKNVPKQNNRIGQDKNSRHHFSHSKQKNGPKCIKNILHQVSDLLDQFRNFVEYMKKEIQRSVHNAMKKLEIDLSQFMYSYQQQVRLQYKGHEFNQNYLKLKEKLNCNSQSQKRFQDISGSKIPVFRTQTLTTQAEKVEKQQLPSRQYNRKERKNPTFSHQIKLRQELRSGATQSRLQKKISLKEVQNNNNQQEIIMIGSNQNIDDYLPRQKSPSSNKAGSFGRFEKKIWHEQSFSKFEDARSIRGDQISQRSSPSRFSRRQNGDRSASKEVEKLRGKLNNLKKLLENN